MMIDGKALFRRMRALAPEDRLMVLKDPINGPLPVEPPV